MLKASCQKAWGTALSKLIQGTATQHTTNLVRSVLENAFGHACGLSSYQQSKLPLLLTLFQVKMVSPVNSIIGISRQLAKIVIVYLHLVLKVLIESTINDKHENRTHASKTNVSGIPISIEIQRGFLKPFILATE